MWSTRSAATTATGLLPVATGMWRLSQSISSTRSPAWGRRGHRTHGPDDDSIDQRIHQVAQPILAGWRRRGLTDDVVFSGRTLPAHLALGILCLELVVHGWDFAVALHRPLHVSDAHSAYILGLAKQTLNAQSRATAGFDPAVPLPADASSLDQLIAFTGRHPVRMRREGDFGDGEDSPP